MATKKAASKTPAKAAKATKAPKAAKAAKPAAAKPAPTIKDTLSKSQLVSYLAEVSGAAAKEVKSILGALEAAVTGAISKKGAGTFVLPGLLKITSVKVPAKPKRKGKNPFTGEETVFAAKPASVKVKVRPLKKLKDAAL